LVRARQARWRNHMPKAKQRAANKPIVARSTYSYGTFRGVKWRIEAGVEWGGGIIKFLSFT
jgi:hypothetical protein